jgi:hypothetical protein
MNQGSNGHAPKSQTARQVHDDIEHTLEMRSAKQGTFAEKAEALAKGSGAALWRTMKRHPFLSVMALGAVGVSAAVAVGVAELAFGSALAIAAYKVLREGEPPLEVLARLERQLKP